VTQPYDAGLSLLCRVDTRLCALPLATVLETMRRLPIEPLAGAPAFVLGLSVIRGAPVPVIDLARLLANASGADAERLVMVRTGVRQVALAVAAVIGIRALPAATAHELPPLMRETDAAPVSAIGALDTELLHVLQSVQLLPDEVWRAIDAEAAR
jgi:purine-binding chemotaxis protein CheW